jgi:hypothetical protein
MVITTTKTFIQLRTTCTGKESVGSCAAAAPIGLVIPPTAVKIGTKLVKRLRHNNHPKHQ